MDIVTVVYALFFYLGAAVLVIGTGLKIYQYATVPAPLKIPTTPAPVTQMGVVLRMAREVFFFQSLFKAHLWLWMFGIVFRAAISVVFLSPFRSLSEPVGFPSGLFRTSASTPGSPWSWAWWGCGRGGSWLSASATYPGRPII